LIACRFDETFDLVLSEDAQIESLFLRICVKDGAVMRKGIFMGEAYLPLSRAEQLNPDLTLRVMRAISQCCN
jgi:hypothetical protein